jgi:RNA polymerase sigma-70 factor (ECF subfamily)
MISLRRYLVSSKNRSFVDPMHFVDDVYRYALARTGNKEDAEDMAIEVVQQAPAGMRTDELGPYMIGMARRKIADHFRHSGRREESGQLPELRTEVAVDQMIDIQRALDTVSDSHRECLILKYVNGMTSIEIALVMEITPEAVDSLLQRARKAFASQWEIMHGEEDGR